MKVVLLARKFDPFGGAERYISHLASSLVAMGHSVSIMAGQWPSASLQEVEIIRIPFAQWDSISAVTSFALSSARAVKELRLSGKVDIVQSFERTLRQDIVRIGHGCHREWLRRRHQILGAWKGAFLSLSPLHQLILFLERRQLTSPETKYVIANSERGKGEVVEHYGINPEKVVVIYNGVDRSRFSPLPLDEPEEKKRVRKGLSLPLDRPLLLFVGSGFVRKGLDFAIQALSALRHLSPLLVVIGRGNRSHYLHLAESLGVGKELLFVEPSCDVAQWYQAADLFLLPSIYEPFSNACLEAMSSGIPVVISADSGAGEVVCEGVNGILSEEISDIPALGAAVEKGLALDRKALRQYNDQILDRFTWEANLSKTISIYERILSERQTDEKRAQTRLIPRKGVAEKEEEPTNPFLRFKKRRPLMIGLTGGLGSGKSTVGKMFDSKEIEVVDTDDISKELMVPGTPVYDEIVRQFGKGILSVEGNINRARLAEIVFQDVSKRIILEQITHPAIREEVFLRAEQAGENGALCFVVEATLIYESHFDRECDAVIVVNARPDQQRERTRQERNYPDHHIDAVLAAQMPLSEKVRRAAFVIDNSGTLEETRRQVEALRIKLIEMAQR